MAQPARLEKLVKRELPHLLTENLRNGWLTREDITPKSVLDALPVSPASTSNGPKKDSTSSLHELLGSLQEPRSDTGEKSTFQHSSAESSNFARHASLQVSRVSRSYEYFFSATDLTTATLRVTRMRRRQTT